MVDNFSENGINDEKELTYERKRLSDIINYIKKEIELIIFKRKKVAYDIINLRQKAIEEFKDDEDKIADYFDQEKYAVEQNYSYLDKRLKELSILNETPYFGRIDFSDLSSSNIMSIYIGRFGLDADDSAEPLVIDWRSPVAALFYNSSLGECTYEAPSGSIKADILLKRQYIIKKRELCGMFDSDREIKDEILQMVLAKNAGDKLRDIVMTIQAEQDEIIRQKGNKTVVVNGAAGSGKTTIALHRVAYLLYNNRDKLHNKVLILGPNDIFMDYIINVLPSLGEVGVRQETFFDFAINIIGDIETLSLNAYMEKIFSDDEEFTKIVKYKTSRGYLQELDKLVCKINSDYFKCEDLYLREKIVITKDEIEKMYYESFKSYPFYKRCKRIKRIVYSRLKDVRNIIAKEINAKYEEEISKLSKEELNTDANNFDFKRKQAIRDLVRENLELKREKDFFEFEDILSIYNKFNNNKLLTVDDLSAILYLKAKLEGFKVREDIRHIVVDEAQDYSILQFKALSEITNCKAYTVVGDFNQKIMPSCDENIMLQLKDILKKDKVYNSEVINYNLTKSYRSTSEIVEYASKFVNLNGKIEAVRNGDKVIEESFINAVDMVRALSKNVDELIEIGFESIAIICKNLKKTRSIAELITKYTHVNVIDDERIIYKGGTVVIPSYFAKGMEFDAVIIVKDKDDEYDGNLMYTMCTRALHKLYIYSV